MTLAISSGFIKWGAIHGHFTRVLKDRSALRYSYAAINHEFVLFVAYRSYFVIKCRRLILWCVQFLSLQRLSCCMGVGVKWVYKKSPHSLSQTMTKLWHFDKLYFRHSGAFNTYNPSQRDATSSIHRNKRNTLTQTKCGYTDADWHDYSATIWKWLTLYLNKNVISLCIKGTQLWKSSKRKAFNTFVRPQGYFI